MPEIWVPEHGGGLTVCLREGEPPETIVWATAAEALLAAATLFADGPCSRSCTRHHSVVWADEHGLHVRPVRGDPPPPSVATELRAL